MKKWIDLRSFVIGGVLALSVVYVLGATPKAPPSGPVRRFAIVVSDPPNSDAFVLDTVTGQVWSRQRRGSAGAFYDPKLNTPVSEEPNEPGS